MKIILIGTVTFSKEMLDVLLENNADILGVVTSADSGINSDYFDLKPLCIKNKIPFLVTDDVNSKKTYEWVNSFNPDVIFCFGWSRLIKKELLLSSPIGVIGYHPAELPKNRGRHPIIWSLVLGLDKTASTFFIMDINADSGDIISQVPVLIDDSDNAETLYKKLVAIAKIQIIDLMSKINDLDPHRILQDKSGNNNWRKRDENDGEIDWRMSADSINNLVRGLSNPYPGAHFHHREKKYIVWETQILDIFNVENIEPGKIIDITNNGEPVVKCGYKCLKLIKLDSSLIVNKGDYL